MHKFIQAILFFIFFQVSSFAQGGVWTWMKGDSVSHLITGISKANYGVKGVEVNANEPPERYEPFYWIDKAGDFWLFGGLGLSSELNDMWKFSTTTNNWTWVSGDSFNHNLLGVYGTKGIASVNNFPSARGWGGVSWTDNNGDLWLFGGSASTGDFEDLWKYHIATNEWTWVKGSNTLIHFPNYGVTGIAASTNSPGSKNEIKAGWVDKQNNLWMFGGTSFTEPIGKAFNDMWKFNTTTNEWTFMKGDKIAGSLGNMGTKGIEADSNMPAARMSFNYWKDANDMFYIFSGTSFGNNPLNDVWKYNLNTNNWTWIAGESNPFNSIYIDKCKEEENIQGGMYENTSPVSNQCANHFWNLGDGNNLSLFNTLNNKWTWLSGDDPQLFPFGNTNFGIKGIASSMNNLPPKAGMAMWVDTKNNVWAFGGYSTTVSGIGRSNDLWRFEPDTSCFHLPLAQTIKLQIPNDTSICEGDTVRMNINQEMVVTISPKSNFSIMDSVIFFYPTSTTIYTISGVSSGSCIVFTDTVKSTIRVKPKPTAIFSIMPSTITLQNPTFQLINQSINSTTNQWYCNNVFLSNSINETKKVNQLGQYCFKLIVRDIEGCMDDTMLCGNVQEDNTFFIPSAFTPNGDLYNNQFGVIYKDGIDFRLLKIFNRFGQEIFVTKEGTYFWDGRYKNRNVDAGTYYYLFEYFDKSQQKVLVKKGDITLIR
jgi:gliding motility-associated-like protein